MTNYLLHKAPSPLLGWAMSKTWPVFLCVRSWLLLAGLPTLMHAQVAEPSTKPKVYSLSQITDFQVTLAERQIVAVAEAMPEEKYGFVPSGDGFKGVRSFAAQIRHIAATNCASWGSAASIRCSVHIKTSNGPNEFTNKQQSVTLLKESFAVGHSAARALTAQNLSDSLTDEAGESDPRLALLVDGVAHDFNHYGQLVEYLRMNNIVPPESRK